MTRVPSETVSAFDRISDLLGVIALFAVLIGGTWLSYGANVPTGGDELMKEVP